jgi:hypothetical protein
MHLRGREHDLGQLAQTLLLLFDEKFGIADQIDEEDMADFEFYFCGRVGHRLLFRFFRREGGDPPSPRLRRG